MRRLLSILLIVGLFSSCEQAENIESVSSNNVISTTSGELDFGDIVVDYDVATVNEPSKTKLTPNERCSFGNDNEEYYFFFRGCSFLLESENAWNKSVTIKQNFSDADLVQIVNKNSRVFIRRINVDSVSLFKIENDQVIFHSYGSASNINNEKTQFSTLIEQPGEYVFGVKTENVRRKGGQVTVTLTENGVSTTTVIENYRVDGLNSSSSSIGFLNDQIEQFNLNFADESIADTELDLTNFDNLNSFISLNLAHTPLASTGSSTNDKNSLIMILTLNGTQQAYVNTKTNQNPIQFEFMTTGSVSEPSIGKITTKATNATTLNTVDVVIEYQILSIQ